MKHERHHELDGEPREPREPQEPQELQEPQEPPGAPRSFLTLAGRNQVVVLVACERREADVRHGARMAVAGQRHVLPAIRGYAGH